MRHVHDAHQPEDQREAAGDDEERRRRSVIESSTIFRKLDGSWTAEPKFVVRQLPAPNSTGDPRDEEDVGEREDDAAERDQDTGSRRQVRNEPTRSRDGILAASALNRRRR